MPIAPQRIGVLGGTFDPIHDGHVTMASKVRTALALDVVLLVPTHRQPFKAEAVTASDDDRVAMCRLAAAEHDFLEVSTVDVERGGTTYTVDTLTDLARDFPDAQLFFIAGADALSRLGEWKDSAKLCTLATFVGVARPGHSLAQLDSPHSVVEIPAMAVSSTDVRRKVHEGDSVKSLVPDVVADYIGEHNLYAGGLDE
ncbi:nicotinate-nucleotide adenylyltransferase [Demequina sediminicola]|uniref:nicotinate-nucleotide adenylyltransferase n=1 Tax=Demequina sediminicola TaxID=1095026 RepID=UPI000784CD71|nr:nicotinate-nucleotide adenylyltransferase [Demequina sediminicola]